MNNNNYRFKQINIKELKEMNEFNSQFFRREEIRIRKEKEKQIYYARRRLEEIGKYD